MKESMNQQWNRATKTGLSTGKTGLSTGKTGFAGKKYNITRRGGNVISEMFVASGKIDDFMRAFYHLYPNAKVRVLRSRAIIYDQGEKNKEEVGERSLFIGPEARQNGQIEEGWLYEGNLILKESLKGMTTQEVIDMRLKMADDARAKEQEKVEEDEYNDYPDNIRTPEEFVNQSKLFKMAVNDPYICVYLKVPDEKEEGMFGVNKNEYSFDMHYYERRNVMVLYTIQKHFQAFKKLCDEAFDEEGDEFDDYEVVYRA